MPRPIAPTGPVALTTESNGPVRPVVVAIAIGVIAAVTLVALLGATTEATAPAPAPEDDLEARLTRLLAAQEGSAAALEVMESELDTLDTLEDELDARRRHLEEAARASTRAASVKAERTPRFRRARTRGDRASTSRPAKSKRSNDRRGRRVKITLSGDGDPMDA